MNRVYYIFLFALAIACGTEEVETDTEQVAQVQFRNYEDVDCGHHNETETLSSPCEEDEWICHSPNNKLHNQTCTS